MTAEKILFYVYNLWNKVFDFQGKETRKDFFLTLLVNFILFMLIYIFISSIFINSILVKNLLFIFGLVFTFGSNSLAFRRLNDVGIPLWQKIAHFVLTFQGRNIISAIKVPSVYLFFSFVLAIHSLLVLYRYTRPSLDKDKALQFETR